MLKIMLDLMNRIRKVAIEEIRERRFSVEDSLGKEDSEMGLRRVNVITGCNGSFKTSILEA